MMDVKETFEKINKRLDNMDAEKVDAKVYEHFHMEIRRKIHVHGVLGQAGEVIPQ
jgi:tetrahydromethanopterin S-methyltransferase subunit G